MSLLKKQGAPFPYFGGKSRIAEMVWRGLGDVRHYIEPFLGSGAVFLHRPQEHRLVTLNERDPLCVNFWRCVRAEPEALLRKARMPVFESNLHAAHSMLIGRAPALKERLEADPDWYEVTLAAWWGWGLCAWIGGGWCSGQGPWKVRERRLIRDVPSPEPGVIRRLPHLSKAGQGFLVKSEADAKAWFLELSERFAKARIACGDWERVCGPSTIGHTKPTGIFFDPPYGLHLREKRIYAHENECATRVQAWCKQHGNDDGLRIVLAGYDGEHNTLEQEGWRVLAWKAHGGYARTERARENSSKERLWFSPHCDNNLFDNQDGLL